MPARALAVVAAMGVPAASAQPAPAAGPGRVEVSLGALWTGHQPLGSGDLNETTPGGGPLKVFTTSSDLASVSGLEGRVAVRLRQSLEAEVEGSYGAPQLKVAISNDFENAPSVNAVERLQQFTIGAGVVWYVASHVKALRLAPFVTAGGGQLRQMHEDRILLETGKYFHVGGGVKYLLVSRPRGFVNAIGARVDVRAIVRKQGVAFDDRGHASPAVGVSAFVRF